MPNTRLAQPLSTLARGNRNRVIVRRLLVVLAVAVLGACTLLPPQCVPQDTWVIPTAEGPVAALAIEVLERATRASIVLLGEQHDSAAHHRWQRETLEALHAIRPNMVIGFEMFPRRVQPALDRWTRGESSRAEFLEQSDWTNVWGFDAALYLPLFQFARDRRAPMLALNAERSLVREVGKLGFDAVPESARGGITKPAAPSAAYVDWLFDIYGKHRRPDPSKPAITRDDAAFRRFVDAQQTWDRAMAQALAQASKGAGRPLVVGVMGSGHVMRGFGVAHQLRDLGVSEVASLIPWSRDDACGDLTPGYADAVFGAF